MRIFVIKLYINNKLERSEIVEFLLGCLTNIVRHNGKKIKSGWNIIYLILGTIAKSVSYETSVSFAKDTLKEIIMMYGELIPEYFEEFITCLLMFCKNKYASVTAPCIQHLIWAIKELDTKTGVIARKFALVKLNKEEKGNGEQVPEEYILDIIEKSKILIILFFSRTMDNNAKRNTRALAITTRRSSEFRDRNNLRYINQRKFL